MKTLKVKLSSLNAEDIFWDRSVPCSIICHKMIDYELPMEYGQESPIIEKRMITEFYNPNYKGKIFSRWSDSMVSIR